MSAPLWDSGPPIVIVHKDFNRLFQHSELDECLCNQLIIDFPCKMGLRTKELGTLKWSNVDIPNGRVIVQDSKNKQMYPIPLNYQIAQKLEEYRKEKESPKFVIGRNPTSPYSKTFRYKHVTNVYLWRAWRDIAKKAGIKEWKDFTPRLGRHYFAANWHKRGGSLEVLRRILRHKSLSYTQIYLSRLVFYEDVQEEYKRIQEIPVIERKYPSVNAARTGGPASSPTRFREFCYKCQHFPVCGYKEQMAICIVAECTYCKPLKPDVPEVRFLKPSRKKRHKGQVYVRGDRF